MSRGERPSIEDLRAFLAVEETGSETAAGKKLGVDQSVIHNRLKVFRERRELVENQHGKIKLTQAGQDAVPAIRSMMRQYEDLKALLASKQPSASATRIAIGSSASQYYLARAIAAFAKPTDDWQIQTRVVRGKQRVAGVVDGTFDLAIVSHSVAQIESLAQAAGARKEEIEVQELARLPLCVIASVGTAEGHALQSRLAGQSVPLELLAEWPLAGLDRESGIRLQLEGRLSRSLQKLKFAQEAGGWLGVKEFVRQGICAGIVPLSMLYPAEREHFAIRRLEEDVAIAHRMIYRKDSVNGGLKPAITALLAAAQAHDEEIQRRWHGLL